MGDFEQAAEVQQRYLDQLEMELFYADGNLPDVALGPIAAVQSSQSLLIYIAHGTDNLGAYLAGQPTVPAFPFPSPPPFGERGTHLASAGGYRTGVGGSVE